jgi:hypothetical protein
MRAPHTFLMRSPLLRDSSELILTLKILVESTGSSNRNIPDSSVSGQAEVSTVGS